MHAQTCTLILRRSSSLCKEKRHMGCSTSCTVVCECTKNLFAQPQFGRLELNCPQHGDGWSQLDPNVKNFNQQIYALWWTTRACSEYLFHLSRSVGAIDIDLVDEFKAARLSTTSISLSRLQAKCESQLRANDSKHLDFLWREFYATGRTGTANKTQYVPMSIMRVFGQ